LGICYDLGDKNYLKYDIMEFSYDDLKGNNVFEIELLKNEDQERKIKLFLKEKGNLKAVKVGEKIAYEKEEKDYLNYLFLGLILFVLSFLITRKVIFRKKKILKKV